MEEAFSDLQQVSLVLLQVLTLFESEGRNKQLLSCTNTFILLKLHGRKIFGPVGLKPVYESKKLTKINAQEVSVQLLSDLVNSS